MGYPQLLAKGGDNLTEKQKEGLKTIEDAGHRMLQMINRSLDLFNMERGTYEYSPASVNLLPVLDVVVAEAQPLAGSKQVSVEIALDGQSPSETDTFIVLGEELLCHVMLENLLKNAVEASPSGERVTIGLTNADETAVAIHNQGAVPPDIRDRFFEKYVTSGKVKGTGLGTYSARLAAETQGGTIRMESSEEGGTTVTVAFPSAAVASGTAV